MSRAFRRGEGCAAPGPTASDGFPPAILPRRLRAHACVAVCLPAGNRRLGFAYGGPGVTNVTVDDLDIAHHVPVQDVGPTRSDTPLPGPAGTSPRLADFIRIDTLISQAN